MSASRQAADVDRHYLRSTDRGGRQRSKVEAANLGLFTIIGLYVGVIPVALRLFWYPLVSRLGRTGLDALLALTVSLLAFLFVDAVRRAGSCRRDARSYQGVALLVAAGAGAYLLLETFGAWLRARRKRTRRPATAVPCSPFWPAVGIGLRNFGEVWRLAQPSRRSGAGHARFSASRCTTPPRDLRLSRPLPRPDRRCARATLGLIGGVPTVREPGRSLVYSCLAVACLGLGAQRHRPVIGGNRRTIGNQIADRTSRSNSGLSRMASAPIALGVAGFGVMYHWDAGRITRNW